MYVAVIRKSEDSDFGVDFPDFPGCISAGKTLHEAVTLAGEALRIHVVGMFEDGESMPAPTSADDIVAGIKRSAEDKSDFVSTTAVALPVLAREKRAKRINITVNANLLATVDEFAARLGETRSAFLAKAATLRMARPA